MLPKVISWGFWRVHPPAHALHATRACGNSRPVQLQCREGAAFVEAPWLAGNGRLSIVPFAPNTLETTNRGTHQLRLRFTSNSSKRGQSVDVEEFQGSGSAARRVHL
jgi:hypothetical protein